MGNLVSVEEKGCFWVLSDSRKDRRMVAGGRRGGGAGAGVKFYLLVTIGDNN